MLTASEYNLTFKTKTIVPIGIPSQKLTFFSLYNVSETQSIALACNTAILMMQRMEEY